MGVGQGGFFQYGTIYQRVMAQLFTSRFNARIGIKGGARDVKRLRNRGPVRANIMYSVQAFAGVEGGLNCFVIMDFILKCFVGVFFADTNSQCYQMRLLFTCRTHLPWTFSSIDQISSTGSKYRIYSI